jgi:hypothetical protein
MEDPATMEIQVAVLADCANVAPPEKLNVMGVFDTIYAPAFPCVHPFMALALRLKIDHEDGGRTHELVVSLRDEEQKEYARATGKLDVRPMATGEVAHVNQILNFAGLGFGQSGRYAFHISWDGKPKSEVTLTVTSGSPGAKT